MISDWAEGGPPGALPITADPPKQPLFRSPSGSRSATAENMSPSNPRPPVIPRVPDSFQRSGSTGTLVQLAHQAAAKIIYIEPGIFLEGTAQRMVVDPLAGLGQTDSMASLVMKRSALSTLTGPYQLWVPNESVRRSQYSQGAEGASGSTEEKSGPPTNKSDESCCRSPPATDRKTAPSRWESEPGKDQLTVTEPGAVRSAVNPRSWTGVLSSVYRTPNPLVPANRLPLALKARQFIRTRGNQPETSSQESPHQWIGKRFRHKSSR